MSTLGTEVATYADVAKRLDANGRVDKIVEVLQQWNEILEDMLIRECNNGTTHKTTVRTGIPSATWRLLNYGVGKAKSTTAQVSDGCGMLETYIEVDKALADLNGNTSAWRLSEASATMAGMSNQMAETVFYGSTEANPERFTGLTPRYNTLNASVPSSENVIDMGGTGSDNTSIWLVCWGETTAHGLFPKGSKAGLSHKDLGEQTLMDAQGGQYQGYREHMKWDLGMTVRDWRYTVRIANIDVSDIVAKDTTSLNNLIAAMIDAEERVPVLGVGKPVWYCNRQVRTALRHAKLQKIAANLTEEQIEGKRVTMFDGFPVRRVDALLNTEARVIA